MFKLGKYLIILMLLASSITYAQLDGFEFRELPRDTLLIIAREIIETDRTCTFITVNNENKPQARRLAYFPPEDDWKIWLGTSTNSRKIKQIRNNPNAMVSMFFCSSV